MNMHTWIASRVCAVARARASWRDGDYMLDNDASHKAASDTCECYFDVAFMHTANARVLKWPRDRAEAGARSIP